MGKYEPPSNCNRTISCTLAASSQLVVRKFLRVCGISAWTDPEDCEIESQIHVSKWWDSCFRSHRFLMVPSVYIWPVGACRFSCSNCKSNSPESCSATVQWHHHYQRHHHHHYQHHHHHHQHHHHHHHYQHHQIRKISQDEEQI